MKATRTTDLAIEHANVDLVAAPAVVRPVDRLGQSLRRLVRRMRVVMGCQERLASEQVELELGVGVRVVFVVLVLEDDRELGRLTAAAAADVVMDRHRLLLLLRARRRSELDQPLAAEPAGKDVSSADERADVARLGGNFVDGVGLGVVEETGGDGRA